MATTTLHDPTEPDRPACELTPAERVANGDRRAIVAELQGGLLAIAAAAKNLNVQLAEHEGVWGITHLIENEAERLYALLDRPPAAEEQAAARAKCAADGAYAEPAAEASTEQTAAERVKLELGRLQNLVGELAHLAHLGQEDSEDPGTTFRAIERLADEASDILHGELYDELVGAVEGRR